MIPHRGAHGCCPHCPCPCPYCPTRVPVGFIEWGYTDRHGRSWVSTPDRGMQPLGRPHFQSAPTKETRWARALRRLAAKR